MSKQTYTVYLAATVRWQEEVLADSLADAAAQAQKFEESIGKSIKNPLLGRRIDDWDKPDGAQDYVTGVHVK